MPALSRTRGDTNARDCRLLLDMRGSVPSSSTEATAGYSDRQTDTPASGWSLATGRNVPAALLLVRRDMDRVSA